jgi:RNA polymerase sigma factor (sigma-70 family)
MNINELLDFQDRLRGFAHNKGGDPADDAAETISICLEKGYDKLPDDEFTRVAFTICGNLIKNRYRRKNLDTKYFPVIATTDKTTDDTSDVSFLDLIAGLDKLEQKILTLNMVEGLRMHEVAEQVGLTYGMARKTKMIAIGKLRDQHIAA